MCDWLALVGIAVNSRLPFLCCVGLLRCGDDGCDALPHLARPAADGGWPLGLLSG